jgi:hypothetical protein
MNALSVFSGIFLVSIKKSWFGARRIKNGLSNYPKTGKTQLAGQHKIQKYFIQVFSWNNLILI